jgi:N-acyl-D-amino-acid deacylase
MMASSSLLFADPSDQEHPVTGTANRNLEPFDKLMTSFVRENKLPGASLAVTRRGKLVYARGFGYAEVKKKEPVQPASLFRIASVSITAVAILQLAAKSKLKLNELVDERIRPISVVGPAMQPLCW